MNKLLNNVYILTKKLNSGIEHFMLSWVGSDIKLTNIEQGTEFFFEPSHLKTLIDTGVFDIASKSEILALFSPKPNPDSPRKLKAITEQKRRLDYVKGAISAGIAVGTQRVLEDYIAIKSLELLDQKAPSAVTLYRWIRAYKKNYDDNSLFPRYKKSGNRLPKIANKHNELLNNFLNTIDLSLKVSVIYKSYLQLVGNENIEPISVNSLRKRITARKLQTHSDN
ncbi:hypothetical protein [Shewanella aestuarii]|uniref:Uncharacterized protein n=1 Tax=Shewanella aestuarii TaxID=1028752 RepID=A0A6G9QQG6_9GAMM|nr:hypothetical protein [Shewanella aestuarii]QIR16353.1 hypothetical protein HBH39_17865 [Shewanella aestuarii]